MIGEHNITVRVPEVAAIDIDHTFIDPDRAMRRLGQAVTNAGIVLSPDLLQAERLEARSKRQPFSPLEVVRKHTTPEVYADVRQRFRTEPEIDDDGVPVSLLYDDVSRFRALLQHHGILRTFTTFGNAWQQDKMVAAGLNETLVVLPTPHKTAYFQALRHTSEQIPQGEYIFAQETGHVATATLCVIDNSIDAFMPNFPALSRGFCIRRGDRFPVDDPELLQLPRSVAVITSFDELTVRDGMVALREPGDALEDPADDHEFVAQFIVPRIPAHSWPATLPFPIVDVARTASSHTLSTL